MAAVVGIYGLGLLLCLAAGVALAGLLDARGRWVGYATIPLGLCALITLLYPLGALMPGYRVAPIAVGIVVAALALAVGLRLWRSESGRRAAGLLAALRPTWAEGVVLLWGAIVGFLVLAPTIEQGFATTIAVSNNDGWGYATLVDWIKDNPLPRDVQPNLVEPLSFVPWSSMDNGFGIGFEHFAAMTATLLDRQGFEVVNSAAAVGLAAAVGGWAALATALRPRLAPALVTLVVVAVASPVLVIPFVENYTTQFVSICLWPFAVASMLLFARAPTWRHLLLAAVANGAVVGVYPVMAPWLVLPLLAIALMVPEEAGWAGSPLRRLAGPGVRRRIARAGAVVALVVAGVAVVAPIQVVRGVGNLLFLDSAPINTAGFLFSDETYAALFLGSAPVFPLIRGEPLAWPGFAGLAILTVAFALALLPRRRLSAPWALLLAVAGGVLVTTGAIFVRYRVLDELPYQVYKGMLSGGAVLAGLAVVGLIAASRPRLRAVGMVGLGCLAAVWIPVTSDNLEASVTPGTGFRAADVQMGRALDALPPGSTVLVEGAAADARSFQYRMMASYFGDRAPELTAIGLGSTASYLTGGGAPEWRPSRPWSHVLRARAEPVESGRAPLWSNGSYALTSAPPLDVTIFGSGWYPPEQDGSGVFAWTSGPVDLVVSNRSATARRARLSMDVASHGRPRVMALASEGRTERRRLPADALTPVTLELVLPPQSATPVALDAAPAASVAAGDGRSLLLRVQGLRVTPG